MMKQFTRMVCLLMVVVTALMVSGLPTVATASSDIVKTYEANLQVRTTGITSLKEYPTVSARNKYTLPKNTIVTVHALLKNVDGSYWYQVLYYNMTLYVDATATTMVNHLTGDVTASDLRTPASIGHGFSFPLRGTISATYNTLGMVTASVHYSSNITTAPAITSSQTIDDKSFTMDGSALDRKLVFGMLAAGSYTFVLSVEAISYYINDKGKLDSHIQTVVLDNKPLIVTSAITANPVIAKGVDVSKWQKNIDWEMVAPQIDFAILRIAYGTRCIDREYYRNISGCMSNDIPFGVYLYSLATNVEEARAEAEYVLEILDGIELDLPVYFDFEDPSQSSLSDATKLAIVKEFCETIRGAGYEPGLYASLSWFNHYFKDDYYDTLHKWVAQINSECTYAGGVQMWQYSWTGSFSGISGDVDCNYFYGEFPGRNTDSSYLSGCTYYPSNLDVCTVDAVNLRQYPSTAFPVLEELSSGTQVHVTGLYRNTYGNYWYQVDREGVTGYISAKYAKVVNHRYDDISVVDPTMTDLELGSIYYLKGRLASRYNNLSNVIAKVYHGENTLVAPVLTSTASPNAKKYHLNHSEVCDNLTFGKLDAGYYTYEISVDAENYYVSNGALLSQTENVVLWTKGFTVGNVEAQPPADNIPEEQIHQIFDMLQKMFTRNQVDSNYVYSPIFCKDPKSYS